MPSADLISVISLVSQVIVLPMAAMLWRMQERLSRIDGRLEALYKYETERGALR